MTCPDKWSLFKPLFWEHARGNSPDLKHVFWKDMIAVHMYVSIYLQFTHNLNTFCVIFRPPSQKLHQYSWGPSHISKLPELTEMPALTHAGEPERWKGLEFVHPNGCRKACYGNVSRESFLTYTLGNSESMAPMVFRTSSSNFKPFF